MTFLDSKNMKHSSVQPAPEILSLAGDFTFKTQPVSLKEFSQIQIVFATCGSPPYWQLKLLCFTVNNNKQTRFSYHSNINLLKKQKVRVCCYFSSKKL